MQNSVISGDLTDPVPRVRADSPAARSADSEQFRGAELTGEVLRRLFQRIPFSFTVRLGNHPLFSAGTEAGGPDGRFTLCFRNPDVVCDLILARDPLQLAEAYFRAELDIEGDLFAALRLKDHLQNLRLPFRERLNAWLMAHELRKLNQGTGRVQPSAGALTRPAHGNAVRRHSQDENRKAIHFHYDVSNEFYRVWLDRAMVYSCAYFRHAHDSLDEAQQAKLEHICRKLLLQPGERFLDIGCGWGALLIHAARHHGVRAHGITLSEKQLEFARRRIAAEGLENQVTVELQDYREVKTSEPFDKVASVGMIEHVGLRNLPVYFSTVFRLLKPSGLLLNHGITHARPGQDVGLSTKFMRRYVFPDGQLETIGNIQRHMEQADFEIADVEALRPHYAMTLRAWVRRLEQRRAEALQFVNETVYRVWRLYMAACALEFESGDIGIYQVLARKRGPAPAKLPLTREHLYDRRTAPQVEINDLPAVGQVSEHMTH